MACYPGGELADVRLVGVRLQGAYDTVEDPFDQTA
jgi:hypothetical protein